MYEDRLDGRISADSFDKKASEWRAEMKRIQQHIEAHEKANESYIDMGCQVLELANHAYELFDNQEPHEKRLFLNFLLSNSVWKDGKLKVTFRKPFDLIAQTATAYRKKKATGACSDDLDAVLRPQRESNPCLRRERPVS